MTAELERERARAEYWKARAKSVAGRANVRAFARVDAMLSEAMRKLDAIRAEAEAALAFAPIDDRPALADLLTTIKAHAQRPNRPPRPSHRNKQATRSTHG